MKAKTCIASLLGMMLFVACSSSAPVLTTNETSWNFLMLADRAVLQEDPTAKTWTITLTHNMGDNQVLFYTDRPAREDLYASLPDFIAQWANFFTSNDGTLIAPNAALSGLDALGEAMLPIAFVLSNPVVNVAEKKITFSAALIDPEHRPTTLDLTKVSLAIDSTSWADVVKACGFGDSAKLAVERGQCILKSSDPATILNCLIDKAREVSDKCACAYFKHEKMPGGESVYCH